jgi:hypothetical protein
MLIKCHRIQESMPSIVSTKVTAQNIQAKSTDGEATPPGTLSVSRSPSISSLMARKTPVEDPVPFKVSFDLNFNTTSINSSQNFYIDTFTFKKCIIKILEFDYIF